MKSMMMKINYYVAILFLLLFCSCQHENNGSTDEEQVTNLEFTLDIGDIASQSKATSDQECPSLEELKELAQENLLLTSISIRDQKGTEIIFEEIELNYINMQGGKLVTDPVLINIPANGQYCFNVTQVTVYDNSQGDMKPIFSSMHESSDNAKWVEEACLLPSPAICLDQDDIYQKIEVNLCVFCTYDKDATYFGYVKWNIQFKRLFCIPFAVNICDTHTNEDLVGVGKMKIETGKMVGCMFIPDDCRHREIRFPTTPHQLADICFVDEMNQSNACEYYRYTMYIGDRKFVGIANVKELLTYASNPEESGYDAANHYIHFWFCDGKTHWFFKECNL